MTKKEMKKEIENEMKGGDYNVKMWYNKRKKGVKKMKGVQQEMGMTDKQFAGFLRMLIDNLNEAKKEVEEDKKTEKLEKVIENLQITIED